MNTLSIHSTELPRLMTQSFIPAEAGHLRTRQVPGVGPDAPVPEGLADAARRGTSVGGQIRDQHDAITEAADDIDPHAGEESQDRAEQ